MSKLAIIDPVGIKAGMNCYDLGLLNALQKNGVETFAFSNFKDKLYPQIYQYPIFSETKKSTLSNIQNFVAAHFKALFICKKMKISWTLLHVFSTTLKDLFSFYVVKLFNLQIIAIIHDVSSLSDEDNAAYRKKMYAMASVLVVHNQTSYNEISKVLHAADKHKLRIIPHGSYVDFVSAHNYHSFADLPNFDPAYKYLLFFGQIKKVKGLDVLLKAVPLLPSHFKIIIAGRPHRDDFGYYQQLIDELNISNRIIPCIRFITDEERDYLFKQCDALILPYRKIFQSGVLLLSMSYSLPVVASDLPANKEVIRDGENGMLFKDGDAADLAGKIRALFGQGNMAQIKQQTLATAKEKYGWDAIATAYMPILKNGSE